MLHSSIDGRLSQNGASQKAKVKSDGVGQGRPVVWQDVDRSGDEALGLGVLGSLIASATGASYEEHGVAVAEEAVAVVDGVMVSAEDEVAAGEAADEDQ